MKYKYNGPVCIPVKAQIVGEELEKLVEENDGALLAETVEQSARSKKSQLHPCFEWDDKIAAHKHRVEQARHLIKAVVVTVENDDPKEPGLVKVRAFPNIETEAGNYYTTIARVVVDKDMTEQYDNQIMQQLLYLRDKYKHYRRYRLVWRAVDTVKQES